MMKRCAACGFEQQFKSRKETDGWWIWVELERGATDAPEAGLRFCSPACLAKLPELLAPVVGEAWAAEGTRHAEGTHPQERGTTDQNAGEE